MSEAISGLPLNEVLICPYTIPDKCEHLHEQELCSKCHKLLYFSYAGALTNDVADCGSTEEVPWFIQLPVARKKKKIVVIAVFTKEDNMTYDDK